MWLGPALAAPVLSGAPSAPLWQQDMGPCGHGALRPLCSAPYLVQQAVLRIAAGFALTFCTSLGSGVPWEEAAVTGTVQWGWCPSPGLAAGLCGQAGEVWWWEPGSHGSSTMSCSQMRFPKWCSGRAVLLPSAQSLNPGTELELS